MSKELFGNESYEAVIPADSNSLCDDDYKKVCKSYKEKEVK